MLTAKTQTQLDMKLISPVLLAAFCGLALLASGPQSLALTKSEIPQSKYPELLTSNGWFTNRDAEGNSPKIWFYFIFNKDGTFSYEEHDSESAPVAGVGAWKLKGDQLTLEFEHLPISLDTRVKTSTIKFRNHKDGYVVLQENNESYWHPELS